MGHRARQVNYIKTSEVIRQPYPLQVRSPGPQTYFMKRETWGWSDFLMNPMVRSFLFSRSLTTSTLSFSNSEITLTCKHNAGR